MSFKAVFEFILLLEDFKNVDLPNQGLAAISASIYKEDPGKEPVQILSSEQIQIFATPYEFPHERTYRINKKKVREGSYVEDVFFRSKVILIKYSEELIPMDDFIQFRMELESFPNLDTENIFLELNLLFSNRYYASKEDKFDGKPVTKVRMHLKDIENGLISFAQADFKEDYFCNVSFTMYCQLMYYKFEKYRFPMLSPTSKQIDRSKIDNFEKLLIWSKQNQLSKDDDPFQIFYSNYVKNLRHSNYTLQAKLNKYLIVKRKIQIKLPKKFFQMKGMKADTEADEKLLRQYLQGNKLSLSLSDIPNQIHEIRIENFELLNTVIDELYNGQFDTQQMRKQYDEYVKQKYGERVFKNTVYHQQPVTENVLKQNKRIAKEMRSKNLSLIEYPIENELLHVNREIHELVFYEVSLPQYMKEKSYKVEGPKKELVEELSEEKKKAVAELEVKTKAERKRSVEDLPEREEQGDIFDYDQTSSQNTERSEQQPEDSQYSPQKTSSFFSEHEIHLTPLKYSEKNMLIVMCHGFQGSSYDMACIHKGIKNVLPNACYLLSRKNEDDTEGDIELMGEKLADEIRYYIRAFMEEHSVIINFVGHSMGGIIARSSLRHLAKFKDQLGFFCSLSSPHLGYLNGVDNKIKVGLWALRKWKPIRSLDQLSMEESKRPRDSFLYKLSREGTLKYFRKLIFFSSFEDSYVAWHSARVSLHSSKNEDSKIENEMVENMLGLKHGKNKDSTIHRLDVNFNVKGTDLNNLIGRTAHINLIIQDSLFDVVNATLPQLFDLREYKNNLVYQ